MATSTDDTVVAEPVTISFTLDSETSARAFRVETRYDGRLDESITTSVSYEASSIAAAPDADFGVRFDTEALGRPDPFSVVPTLRLRGPAHTVAFSLADPNRNGPVTIDLEITASYDGGESVDGTLDISVEQDDGFPLEDPATARVEFRPTVQSPNFTFEQLELASTSAAPNGRLTAALTRVGPDLGDESTSPVIVTDQRGQLIELVPGEPIDLALPPSCADGPCQYVLNILRLRPVDAYEPLLWQLDLHADGIDLLPSTSPITTATLRGETTIPATPLGDLPTRRTLVVDVSAPAGSDHAALFHIGFALRVDKTEGSDSDAYVSAKVVDASGRVVADDFETFDGDLLSESSAIGTLVPVVNGRNEFTIELSRGRVGEADAVGAEGTIATTLHSSGPLGAAATIALTVSDG